MRKTSVFAICFSILILFVCYPSRVGAVPGCCSWHGGESGCSGGKTLCADGTVSSCPCDGTTSFYGTSSGSDNYNNSSTNDNIGLAFIIYGGMVVLFIAFAYTLDGFSKHKQNVKIREKEREKKLREEHNIRIQEEKQNDIEHLIENSDDENEINHFIDNINPETLSKYTSNDLFKLVNSNNEGIFKLLGMIKIDCFSYNLILDFCYLILENDELSLFQKKCIKYILENDLTYSYEEIFIKMIEKKHESLINFVLNNCNHIEFNYDSSYKVEKLFNSLLTINDYDLVKKISGKKNFTLKCHTSILEKNSTIYIKNKYLFFITLFKKDKNFNNLGEKIIGTLNFKDNDNLTNVIDEFLQQKDFLKDKGYIFVYMLIRSGTNESIEYLLNNSKEINLDQRINGITPLIYACFRNKTNIVEKLINYGVDGNFADINGNTPLEYACEKRNMKMIKLLYEKGYRLDSEYDNSNIEYCIKRKENFPLPHPYIRKIYDLRKK